MSDVMIIAGSDADREMMEEAIWPLYENGVDVEVHVLSAKRPGRLKELIQNSHADVFIAGAGMVAALTKHPVIGVPLSTDASAGIETLLNIVKMPRSIPAATVGLDGAEYAAKLALQFLQARRIA